MTILEIKSFMKTNKITYEMLSKKSGIPLTTLKYIFSGKTENPRIDTMRAIETALEIDTAWTSNDLTNGISLTKKVSITADEEEVLDKVKDVIALLGEDGKELIVDFCNMLLNKLTK